MNIERFFSHHGIRQNPFAAEEARLDPIFEQLALEEAAHPEMDKILGSVQTPSTSVVFGEKGSGKTAMRLLMSRAIDKHNQQCPDQRVLQVAYDDMNPYMDRLLSWHKQNPNSVLKYLHLSDHQDAILSIAVTQIVDELIAEPNERVPWTRKSLRRLDRNHRIDLLTLAALYDQPHTGNTATRFMQLRKRLGLHWQLPLGWFAHLGALFAVLTVIFWAVWRLWNPETIPTWILPAAILSLAIALASLGYWIWRAAGYFLLDRRLRKAMPAIRQDGKALRRMLSQLGMTVLKQEPLPTAPRRNEHSTDTRYQLTRRLIDAIQPLGYVGLIVMVDRVDEPTIISGDVDRMRSLVWPMLDNKYLQQKQVGIKLLLPMELRNLLHRESPAFFQEARLDKQNLVDRLAWSGSMLYDLCNQRLRACMTRQDDDSAEPTLKNLFDEQVSRSQIVDALDQMHQPRDAFKFLYAVIQEHCRLVSQDEDNYLISRVTFETVRRDQSRRLQDFDRGIAPA